MKAATALLILYSMSLTACNLLGGGDEGPPRTIVFSAQNNEEGTFQIFSMREDGSGVKQLTDEEYSSTDPAWSPDGTRIAFTSNRDYFDADTMQFRKDIYMVDSNGENLIRLTDIGKVTIPKWGPDGKYIAYSWQRLDPDIYLIDLESKKIIELTNLKFVGVPMWNYDGSQLLISGTTLSGKRVFQLISTDGKLLKETELNFEGLGGTREFDWYNDQ